MRFSFALAVLSAVVAVQASTLNPLLRRQGFPDCAGPCITGADTGTCGSDNVCLCNSPAFVTSTTQCIQSACTGEDRENAEAAARALCAAVGVTLTSSVPPATATSESASQSASESSAEASSASSASASATSASATSIPSSASSAASSAASSVSSALSSIKSSASAAASSASSATSPSASASGSNGAITSGASLLVVLGAVGLTAVAL